MQDRHLRPRVGCVKFLNARPLIHGWPGEVLFDNPSTLCRKLAAGALDVALVSSFEYLRNPIYRIIDDIAIASDGPVYSVVVAHRDELSRISEIELDPASETSINLLRILLAKRGLKPRLIARSTSAAQLLIGDNAIRFRETHPEFQFWDLGEEWKRLTALPFVYALWLVRPEVTDVTIADELRAIRDENLRKIDNVISEQSQFDPEFCRRYFRENLRFTFGEREKAGLQKFAEACADLNLIAMHPPALELV
ncbi:MAG: chorismate dehydratase [Verrucomicrobiota bacterium]